MRYIYLLLLVSAACVLTGCDSDPEVADPYSLETWETFNTSDGLSSDYIMSMKCDSEGTLWVGTLEDGIMRFDGQSWTFLDAADGIHNNTILAIEEDAGGQIWFGTLVGISIYDGSSFTNLYYQGENEPVLDILTDRDRNMWLATVSKGLLKLDWQGGTTAYSAPGFPGSDSVLCIAEDERGTIWAGTEAGVLKIAGSRVDFISSGQGIPDQPVSAIHADRWGNVWFGSLGDRHLVRLTVGSYESISLHNTRAVNLVYDILEAPGGDLWFGLGRSGAVRFNGSNMETYRDVDGLPGNTIQCMESDQQGQIWFGSYGQGLSVYRPGPKDLIPAIQ